MARLKCIFCGGKMVKESTYDFVCSKCGSEASYNGYEDKPTSDPEDYDWDENEDDAIYIYDDDYDEVFEGKPDCCRGCGGNYPDCMDSCEIFDD